MSMKTILQARGLLDAVPLSAAIDALLEAINPKDPEAAEKGSDVRGKAAVGLVKDTGELSLNLVPPGPNVPFHLVVDEAAASFRLWLILSATEPAKAVFGFVAGLPGRGLIPAVVRTEGPTTWLEPDPAAGPVVLTGLEVALLVEGSRGTQARLRFTPTDGAVDGIVALNLEPSTVLLGDSGFGLELSNGLVLDDTDQAVPPGETMLNGTVTRTKADDAEWRGLVVRQARFFVPRGVPLLGGRAVDAFVEIGFEPGAGIDLAVATSWPSSDGHPGVSVLIECRDPAATGLQDFLPTLVEASVELPLTGDREVGGLGFTVTGGRPLTARARFSRSVGDPTTRLSLALEAHGSDGVLAVRAPAGGVGARVVIGAGAFATALVADAPPAGADASGVVLHTLLVAGLGLSALLKNSGGLVVHGVELQSMGHGLPVGGAVTLTVDYSVDVVVDVPKVGVLSISMNEDAPMRVRNRNVGLTVDPHRSGLEMFSLDFSRADMEIEDPGRWTIQSPGSLFDILGTRSGRGSMWFEVDLRFRLDLGPVKVSGATIRVDLTAGTAGLRGLDATLKIPGVVAGRGAFQMLEGGGFAAELDVDLTPLNVATTATAAD